MSQRPEVVAEYDRATASDGFWRTPVRLSVLAFLFWCASAAFADSTGARLSSTNIFAPASTPAKSIFGLSLFVLIVTGLIFAVVFTLLAYAVVKFRAR